MSLYTCDVNAVCVNTIGNYTCQCNDGYMGDGKVCSGKNLIFSFSNYFIMVLGNYFVVAFHAVINLTFVLYIVTNVVFNLFRHKITIKVAQLVNLSITVSKSDQLSNLGPLNNA